MDESSTETSGGWASPVLGPRDGGQVQYWDLGTHSTRSVALISSRLGMLVFLTQPAQWPWVQARIARRPSILDSRSIDWTDG